jgi:hypothetical protein
MTPWDLAGRGLVVGGAKGVLPGAACRAPHFAYNAVPCRVTPYRGVQCETRALY